MESVTIKVHKEMLNEIKKSIKPDYGTKSEFIRDAIREKLEKKRQKELIKHFEKYFGGVKKKTSYKREKEIREIVGKKYAKKFGIELD